MLDADVRIAAAGSHEGRRQSSKSGTVDVRHVAEIEGQATMALVDESQNRLSQQGAICAREAATMTDCDLCAIDVRLLSRQPRPLASVRL